MTSGKKKQKQKWTRGFEVQLGKSQNRQVTKSNFVQSPKILSHSIKHKCHSVLTLVSAD